jgi:hypothetical protein
MDMFTVHFVAQKAIGSPVNIYMKGRKMAVSFRHHGELNILVHTVQVVRKSFGLSGPFIQMTKVSST